MSGTAFVTGKGHSLGKFESGILTIGSRDSGKGLQTLNVNLSMNDPNISGSLQYRIYVSKKGWQEWVSNGQNTGMSTKPSQITAIQIKLDGQLGEDYSIWYGPIFTRAGRAGYAMERSQEALLKADVSKRSA